MISIGNELKKDLASLVKEYSAAGELLDADAIFYIIERIVEECDLENQVTDVKVINDRDENNEWFLDKHLKGYAKVRPGGATLASYSCVQKDILIFLDRLTNCSTYTVENYQPEDEILFRNMNILKVIFHELEHAQQYKGYCEREKHDVDSLLYYGLRPQLLLNDRTKNEVDLKYSRREVKKIVAARKSKKYDYYSINPCERLAEIYAICNTLDIIYTDMEDHQDLLQVYLMKYWNKLYDAYDSEDTSLLGPTHDYFDLLNMKKVWKAMPFYDGEDDTLFDNVLEYSPEYRLAYGLPIFREDEEFVLDQQQKLRTSLNIR